MTKKRYASLIAGLLFTLSAHAWEVGEFKSGMLRTEVEASQTGRRFLFSFCNDKLVSFDQEVPPTFRHFIVISSNYSNQYGNPFKVIPVSSVIANGEKNVLALFWRKGTDFIGVKYALYPTDEQLSTTWQVNNNCWQAPR